MIILPRRRTLFTHTDDPGLDWDELTEAGIADGDIFACLLEGGAAANETGQGAGLGGADLVLTQTGNLAASSGTPPFRTFDGVDDRLDWTQNALDTITAGVWTMVWKIDNHPNEQDYIADLSGGVPSIYFWANVGLFIYYGDTTNGVIWNGTSTANTPPTTSKFYIILTSNGSKLFFGWHTSLPSKLSAIPTANRLLATVVTDAGTFNSRRQVFGSAGGTNCILDGYFFLAAKKLVFTFDV